MDTLPAKLTRRYALMSLPGAVLPFSALGALAQQQNRLTATVVDVTGIETEVRELRTERDPFGRGWGDCGFPVIVRKFGSEKVGFVVQHRWFYFDQIDTLTVQKSSVIGIKLRSGDQVTGELVQPYGRLRGQWTQGTFELPWDKVKSIAVKGKVDRPVVSVMGPKGTIVLRDGTRLAAHDLLRYRVAPSGFINVPSRRLYDPDLYLKYQRGAGLVKTSVPFGKIDEIIFATPPPDDRFRQTLKLVLRDGSVLSGTLGGDGPEEGFDGLAGRSELGPFWITGGPVLHLAIQSIRFSE